MDDFKNKSIRIHNGPFDDYNTPKKFGRKSARRSLKKTTNEYYDSHDWYWWDGNDYLNIWDCQECFFVDIDDRLCEHCEDYYE